MFNKELKVQLAKLQNRVYELELTLDRRRIEVAEHHSIAERRFEWTTGEVKRLDKLAGTVQQFVDLSHVDAYNIKVPFPLADVVQSLADHLRLAVLPEAEAEIVVLNEP